MWVLGWDSGLLQEQSARNCEAISSPVCKTLKNTVGDYSLRKLGDWVRWPGLLACVGERVRVPLGVHAPVCTWRPEVDTGRFLYFSGTYSLRQDFSLAPGVFLSQLPTPVVGLQVCLSKAGLYIGVWDIYAY